MATADVILAVASGLFNRAYAPILVYSPLARDRSAEMMGGGDALTIPKGGAASVTTVTQANYQGGVLANHRWPDPNIDAQAGVTLNVDQYIRINEGIPTMHQLEIRADVLEDRSIAAGRASGRQVNNYYQGMLQALTGAPVLTAISVTAANFAAPNAAFLAAVRKAFRDAKTRLDYEEMPTEGRRAVVSPYIAGVIEQYFEDAKIPFAVGQTNEEAVQAGFVMMLSGFRIIMDPSRGPGVSNTDDNKHSIFFLRAGEGLSRVQRDTGFHVVPPTAGSDFDGWQVRRSLNYGAIVDEPEKVAVQKINIT